MCRSFAIGVIAFIAGLQLNLAKLGPRLGAIVKLSVTTVVVALAGMSARSSCSGAAAVRHELTGVERAGRSALVGTLLVGVSPILTTAVHRGKPRARPLSTISTAVVVSVELLVIVFFAICCRSRAPRSTRRPAQGLALALSTVW